MKAKQNQKPADWQLDSTNIKTNKVQYWRNGVMAQILDKDRAIALVNQKKAFVMCDQAIGALNEKGEYNS